MYQTKTLFASTNHLDFTIKFSPPKTKIKILVVKNYSFHRLNVETQLLNFVS